MARCDAQQRFQHTDHWGPDEHEQVRALQLALDEAKRDFQELSPLVNGQGYYERDRTGEWQKMGRERRPTEGKGQERQKAEAGQYRSFF